MDFNYECNAEEESSQNLSSKVHDGEDRSVSFAENFYVRPKQDEVHPVVSNIQQYQLPQQNMARMTSPKAKLEEAGRNIGMTGLGARGSVGRWGVHSP